jgi:glyoxylase-like metal-dependent hydrolase (beta-lactamase superfamily II)
VRAIDVHHMGRERVTCCWHVGGVLIDPGPESSVHTLLEALGDDEPEAILLTHIHLDHAGATGSLTQRWPDIPVFVHELGAPHLIDPEKLEKSAGRLWDDMEERWGHTKPVPEASITLVQEGDSVNGFEVAYTPGHASHHVSYFHNDSGWAFAGDVAGVRAAAIGHTLMPTPPPDIDVEKWHESIDKLEAWRPKGIGVAHFGGHEDVAEVLTDARQELDKWARKAKQIGDHDAFTEAFEADLALNVPDRAILESMRPASEPRLEYPRVERYWRKRAA